MGDGGGCEGGEREGGKEREGQVPELLGGDRVGRGEGGVMERSER